MITKNYLSAVGLTVLMGIAVAPFRVGADEPLKSEKTLDPVPVVAPAAAVDAKPRDAAPAQREYADGYLAQRLGTMQRSTNLPGTRVLDHYDMPLGKVADLLVDLPKGRIYCALVSLGDADYTVAVPGRSFFPADDAKVILDLKKDVLTGAPRLKRTDWEFATLRKSIGESYAYFNQKPFWDEKAGLGRINRIGDFIGMEVRDKDNADLGKAIDLMVDLPTARIVFVVISFDGSDKNLYAVPPAALMLTSDNKALFLDDSRDKVRGRALQNDYFWTEATDRSWAANTYRIYGVEPDFDPPAIKADPAREAVRAKVDDTPTVASKLAGKSDAEVTRMVLTAMVREDMDNAFNHKNIKINTLNGHVTLTGRIKNEKQRSRLGTIAEGVVGAGFVDNQLDAK